MQIHRLVAMIYILLERKMMTAKELAEHFEVSTRTIYRDVEALAQAGIPIYASKGQGGGIGLTEQFVLNKSVLTKEERQGVLAALQGLQAVQQSEAKSALDKLSAILGGEDEDWIEVDFGLWDGQNIINERFALLRQAIFERRLTGFSYAASGQAGGVRTGEPMKLVCRGHDWYLLAWCRLREDYRYFKLTRMTDLVLMEERFVRRPLPAQQMKAAEQLALARPMLELVVYIAPEMVYRLRDDFCSLELETLADGRLLARLAVPEGPWLYPYLLAFGESLEVIAPETIRQALMRQLQKASERYGL